MDVLAAMVFGIIILKSARDKGHPNRQIRPGSWPEPVSWPALR